MEIPPQEQGKMEIPVDKAVPMWSQCPTVLFTRIALLSGFVLLMAATRARADIILLQDVAGTAEASFPPYYVAGCTPVSCGGTEGYPFSPVLSDSIPATVYIGDPAGFVSDKITSSVTPAGTEFTIVEFSLLSGLDLNASPTTCASVGGCLTYDGLVQTLGTITYGNTGLLPAEFTTTLEYEHLATPEPATLPFAGGLITLMLLVVTCRRRRAIVG